MFQEERHQLKVSIPPCGFHQRCDLVPSVFLGVVPVSLKPLPDVINQEATIRGLSSLGAFDRLNETATRKHGLQGLRPGFGGLSNKDSLFHIEAVGHLAKQVQHGLFEANS